MEVALYGYQGFWKSPGGFDPLTGNAIFPELRVYGASLRSRLGQASSAPSWVIMTLSKIAMAATRLSTTAKSAV